MIFSRLISDVKDRWNTKKGMNVNMSFSSKKMCIEASKWEEAKCLQQISNKYTLSLPLNKVDHHSKLKSSFPTPKSCTEQTFAIKTQRQGLLQRDIFGTKRKKKTNMGRDMSYMVVVKYANVNCHKEVFPWDLLIRFKIGSNRWNGKITTMYYSSSRAGSSRSRTMKHEF